jgi:hypothetical protein
MAIFLPIESRSFFHSSNLPVMHLPPNLLYLNAVILLVALPVPLWALPHKVIARERGIKARDYYYDPSFDKNIAKVPHFPEFVYSCY